MPRGRLAGRRRHDVQTFEHGGIEYTLGIGRYSDGRVGELFLAAPKSGTAADDNARDAAIIASLALQHGAELEVLRHALTRNSDGSPASAIGAAVDIVTCAITFDIVRNED